MDSIETAGITAAQFEEVCIHYPHFIEQTIFMNAFTPLFQQLKSKIAFGAGLRRAVIKNNKDRDLPLEIAVAGRDTHYLADEF